MIAAGGEAAAGGAVAGGAGGVGAGGAAAGAAGGVSAGTVAGVVVATAAVTTAATVGSYMAYKTSERGTDNVVADLYMSLGKTKRFRKGDEEFDDFGIRSVTLGRVQSSFVNSLYSYYIEIDIHEYKNTHKIWFYKNDEYKEQEPVETACFLTISKKGKHHVCFNKDKSLDEQKVCLNKMKIFFNPLPKYEYIKHLD